MPVKTSILPLSLKATEWLMLLVGGVLAGSIMLLF